MSKSSFNNLKIALFTLALWSTLNAKELHLDVFINEQPTKLIAQFTEGNDGKFSAKAKELKEIGIRPPDGAKDDDSIALDSIAGLRYRYDMPTQTMLIEAEDKHRLAKGYETNLMSDEVEKVQSKRHFGSVTNYSLFSSAAKDFSAGKYTFGGVSGTLDTRIFGAFGTVTNGVMVGNATSIRRPEAVRLDTTWQYSHKDSMTLFKGGDFISGGLAWSRPMRMGGLQISRNFGLRSDLVAQALPGIAGSAAVPSTVDIYVNNTRTYSQTVDAGPFRINNLPVIGSNGLARVVVTEPNGRTTESTQSFFVSPQLLKKGMLDYSAEIGQPRIEYGVKSNSYVNKGSFSATTRYGLTDTMTLENHFEATKGFTNSGAGLVTSLMNRHLVTVAGSLSHYQGVQGKNLYASFETHFNNIWVNMATQRSFGDYQDLASVTAKPILIEEINPFSIIGVSNPTVSSTSFNAYNQSLKPMKQMDRFSIGAPIGKASLSFSYISSLSAENIRSKIYTSNLSFGIGETASAFMSVFSDQGDKKNHGLFAGVSMPLGKTGANMSLGVNSDNYGKYATLDISKPIRNDQEGWGYRFRDVEGSQNFRSASLMHKNKYVYTEVAANQNKSGMNVTSYVSGAIAAAGGSVFLTNRVDDSFAVVKATAPNVEVFYENRLIGKTNKSGTLIIPSLRSGEGNKVTINPNNLPITASIDTTKTIAVPSDKGVSIVDFGVVKNPQAAIVSFVNSKNEYIPAGSILILNEGEKFMVGHDGRTYLKGLDANNKVTIAFKKITCKADFNYIHDTEAMTHILKVPCI